MFSIYFLRQANIFYYYLWNNNVDRGKQNKRTSSGHSPRDQDQIRQPEFIRPSGLHPSEPKTKKKSEKAPKIKILIVQPLRPPDHQQTEHRSTITK